MTHFDLRHLSPELVRLLLACVASVALVSAIYLADLSFWQRGSFATRAQPSPAVALASTPAPSEQGGGVIALAELPASTAPVVQAPPSPEPLQRYTVKPGDSLIAIGLYFGAHTADLIALNGLPADGFLYAGQELKIPRGPVASPAAGR
jgi:LysM repeat protein